MGIIDKLNHLMETKEKIKNAIISKGQNIVDTDTFESYAEKISNMSTSCDGLMVISDNRVESIIGEPIIIEE